MEEHRCRNTRCVAKTNDGSALTLKPNTLCNSCIASIQDKFDQLPEIQEVLKLFLGGIGGSSAQTKVAASTEPPVPVNLHCLDVINEIRSVINRAGGVQTQVVNLIRQDDGVNRALHIDKVYRKADNIIGLSRAWNRRLMPCPKCQLQTLGSFAGSDTVTCSNCAAAMTRKEYARLCIITSEK